MFNADFDVRVLRHQLGWKKAYCTWDCYLAMRLLNENETVNKLKPLHNKYVLDGEKETFSFDDLFKGIKFNLIPLSLAELYAGNDPVITYEFYEYQHKYLREDSEREDMRRIYWVMKNIEMPCVDVIATMEDNGVLIDNEIAKELHHRYTILLNQQLHKVYTELDVYKKDIDAYKALHTDHKLSNPINISSPNQLAIILYDILNMPVYDKDHPRGTGEDILKKMKLPLTKEILEYRTLEKLIGTYIDKLPNCTYADGKIRCTFKQYGADTGRMSSKDPNLQNIPSKNKDIRKMFRASEGYVLMSSDFSQQEPKALSALCKQDGDSQMYDTFMQGKDLYTEIASKAFNLPYRECLEHFPKGTPIKEIDGHWYYAKLKDGTADDIENFEDFDRYLEDTFNPELYEYDKIADGKTDTYADGKSRRTSAKSILLGVLYSRGEKSIAEQLGCTLEKAQDIKQSVFRGFPAIKEFEQSSLNMAHTIGYVTTVCGRKRRLPDINLPQFEFYIMGSDRQKIPSEKNIQRYIRRLRNCSFKDRPSLIQSIKESDGVEIIDNTGKIASAKRQCVNARVQGSSADLTKLAMIDIHNNKRLQELGFRLLIPVHDEVIAECPRENAKECSELLAEIMSKSAEKILEMPIKCDVEVTTHWYGEEIELDD